MDFPDPHPGAGQVRIAVRAASVNPSDWKKRQGLMDDELPQTLGYEAAGAFDKLGEGVTNVAVGDRVFGFSGAAALPAAVETATRALDQLGVGGENTLLISGASGNFGSAAVQLAVVRGARVIGTASPANHDHFAPWERSPSLTARDSSSESARSPPDGIDLALDVAGSGILPELIELTGAPDHVITIADFNGAHEHGVRFSRGDSGRAVHALNEITDLIESGRFSLPVTPIFPLTEVAKAHHLSETGPIRGKLVLLAC